MDEARTWLFPLYSSTLTPTWLRSLGAKIGEGVEASTVLMLPALTSVNGGAFLADDTMLGMIRAWWGLAADRAGQDRAAGRLSATQE